MTQPYTQWWVFSGKQTPLCSPSITPFRQTTNKTSTSWCFRSWNGWISPPTKPINTRSVSSYFTPVTPKNHWNKAVFWGWVDSVLYKLSGKKRCDLPIFLIAIGRWCFALSTCCRHGSWLRMLHQSGKSHWWEKPYKPPLTYLHIGPGL